MTNGHIPEELPQSGLIKNLAHKPHAGVDVNSLAIGGGNSGAFLTTVLKRV
jgi:hypothetical protein